MTKAGESPWWLEPPDPRADGSIDDSLLRAMEDDPRLGHGAGPARSDNVLDFIQMTGLTTGRIPAAVSAPPQPGEHAGDPISFFEYGVRDVDGSGDPVEMDHPELDFSAFHVKPVVAAIEESESLNELRQIIAELAEETDPARTAYARLVAPEASPADPGEPEVVSSWSPGQFSSLGPTRVAEAPPAREPAASAARPAEPSAAAAGLVAARDLLIELSQANDAAAERQRAHGSAPLVLKHPVTLAREGLPESEAEAEKEDYSSHQHLGLPRRRPHSMARRWLQRVAIVAIAAALGYGAWEAVRSRTQPPKAAFDSAKAVLDSGDHRRASNEFLSIARRFSGHPVAPDALFMAGFALQLEAESPPAPAKEAYTEAIGIFEKFIAEHPAHEKTARAETLMGLLHYKTGRYLEAISVLGGPDRRVRDPGAYLSALRTLGRAYAEVGQTDNARSAFLRAAALESNMTPDQDYIELATLYQNLAAHSGEPAQRRHHFQLAVEQWDFAMRVPGLLRARKEDVKLLRDAAAGRLESETGGAVAPGPAASEGRPTQIRTNTLANRSAGAGESPPADSEDSSGRAPK